MNINFVIYPEVLFQMTPHIQILNYYSFTLRKSKVIHVVVFFCYFSTIFITPAHDELIQEEKKRKTLKVLHNDKYGNLKNDEKRKTIFKINYLIIQ